MSINPGVASKDGDISDVLLRCENVTKQFGSIVAVDDVSITIEEGEWVSIVGANGAGKTTLMNVINGFWEPTSGRVYYKDKDITHEESHTRARKGIARTFQGVELFEAETVVGNILTIQVASNNPSLLESLVYYGPGKTKMGDNLRRVEEIIEYLELWEYRDEYIQTLPLGVRRRVELGRALALDPEILLLDEAMSGLTFDEKYDMVRFITDLHDQQNLTIIMIEHDLEVVTSVSERMIVLDQGAVLESGDPDYVTNQPEVARVYTGVDEDE